MAISIGVPDGSFNTPCIKVIGVGGAGCNAVNNMIEFGVKGAEFVVANTDAQALTHSLCESTHRLQLGACATRGLGAGSNPEIGRMAAEESIDDITSHLEGASMVFITAGMGGGTGTGAAPVIARISRELDILTVGVVTTPFDFEGLRRKKIAMLGLEEMEKNVDTLIIIPNQNLFRVANENTTFKDVFKRVDNVLRDGVNSITALMVNPGLINLDFADIKSVMQGKGRAMMGTGEASGDNRAMLAADCAISNPLLDNNSMKGAKGVLVNISGGDDLTLFEVDAAVGCIKEEVDSDANIIFGSTFDESLNGSIKISVVATGVGSEKIESRLKTFTGFHLEEKTDTPVSFDDVGADSDASDLVSDETKQDISNLLSMVADANARSKKAKELASVSADTDINNDSIDIPAFMRRRGKNVN
ncbi:cell division protein FtsZ [Candidatus Xenohaliotis californiensis]